MTPIRLLLAAALFTLVTVAPYAQSGSDKWDITAATGPTSAVSFETSEGTWMNVDVSPDGRRVVFDLLGDLYTMPIEGSGPGPAARITSGVAFDMQPRFSPDGKSIAFISDRGGLFNVWLADADGQHPRQISKEQRWWINSPTWSPDGQYIYARRHFVGERSLGAGEVWMFHVSGSEGVQVTERASIQKDAGEPALSPDGKTLYYSRDVSPGPNFDYNRDPYGVIYAIYARDLATGRERQVTGRPGGSITPRVSPDGKFLSFIRRVRLKSVLHVRNIETGEETAIFDGLDRDLQEAWSINGVYPQYAWTPDNRTIVIWGQGKVWRVSVQPDGEGSTNAGAEIPFRAAVQQTVTEALRFQQPVLTEEFPVRMLTGVRTSPDGTTVAYSALGKIWIKTIAGGAPRRLTSSDAFEFFPSFSPDGQSVVFTSWSDVDRGRVRIVRANGSSPRDLVTTPGHYVEPSFSPDGQSVVYRSTRADGIRGITHGQQTGIFIIPAGGGTPALVRDGGDDPQFDHTGERVYFRDRRDSRFILASVTRSGGEEVVHFRSENATAIIPSPDGKWVAFAERWHLFVAAFPRSGRPVDLGPRTGSYPVNQISRDAGFSLHWSTDSRRVHWVLGGDFFSRQVTASFPFLEGRTDSASSPEATGVPIGFTTKADAPTGTIALTGARVLTMTNGQTIDNATVIVEGNRIKAVGRDLAVPAGARRIDARGKTIMPGLIDAHAHVGGESDGLLAQTSWPLLANLAFGVTSSHDPSNDTETVFSNSELVRAGGKLGPRLYSTGTILYGAESPFKAVIENYDDAMSHLRRLKASGAFSVKSYNQQRRDVRQMILKAARELQMNVVPEGGSLLYHDLTMIADGHTTIEHSLPVANVYKDVVDFWSRTKVAHTPTLIVGFGGLSGEFFWYERDNVWEHERLLTFTPRDVVDARSRRRIKAAGDEDFNHIAIARHVKRLADAGVVVNMGAHGQLQGLGAHWEIWMLAQGGMPPMQALAAATINPARSLGLDRELGSLEPGKLADLIVLDRNPLENIRNTDSVSMVMVNGRLYEAATLNEVASGTKKRGPLYWEH